MTAAEPPVRIALWSGPRNISTAMMRAFENRPDTAVIDEPFYAAWLTRTGAEHPMRAEILAAQPADWRAVVAALLGPVPGGRAIFYQKHMAQHITPDIDLAWMAHCRHAFLIRPPEAVLASYVVRGGDPTPEGIGAVQLERLFMREADRLGAAPPVIEAGDVLADPRGALTALCAALDIPYDDRMPRWPPGRRPSDGVWAPAWYDAVERSTGFGPPRPATDVATLSPALRAAADAARPFYQRLARYRLTPAKAP